MLGEKGSNDYSYQEVTSFDILASLCGNVASVRGKIYETIGVFKGLRMNYKDEKKTHDTFFFIVRKTEPIEFPYHIQIIVPETPQPLNISFIDLEEVTFIDKKKRAKCFLTNGNALGFEFMYTRDFLLFQKYVYLKRFSLGEHSILNEFYRKSFTSINSSSSSSQSKKETNKKKKKKKKKGGFSQVSISESERKSSSSSFHCVNSREWKYPEFEGWLMHIPASKIVKKLSLYDKLKEEKCLDLLKKHIFDDSTVYDDDVYISAHPIKKLKRVLETNKISNLPERFKERLLESIDLLEDVFEGNFSMEYYHTLLKFMSRLKKNNPTPLGSIERYFILNRRHLFNVEECRNMILIGLFYNSPLEVVLDQLEDLFITFYEEQKKKKRNEHSPKDDDDNNNNNNNNNAFSPEDFDQMMKEFNESAVLIQHQFPFSVQYQRLVFGIHLRFVHNEIRKERCALGKKLEERKRKIKELEEKNSEIRNFKIKSQKEKIEKLKEKINREETKPSMKLLLEKSVTRLEKSIPELGERLKRGEEEIETLKNESFEIEKEISKKKKEMYTTLSDRSRMKEREFYCSKFYQREMNKFVDLKIQEFEKGSVLFETKVKLVLAFTKHEDEQKREGPLGEIINGVEKLSLQGLSKVFDPLFNPDFFNFGLTHSFLLIKNFRFDWFDNAFVFFEDMKAKKKFLDKFEIITCLDCDVPFITVHPKSFKMMIHQFAAQIVHWNSNVQYSSFNIGGGEKNKNCQEFVLEMLNTLNSVPFYPRVERWIKGVKDLTSKKHQKEKSSEQFRSVKFDDQFKEKFEPILKEYGWLEKGRITFERHEQLDNFARDLRNADVDFSINFPGYFSLFKGFDRAFWMNLRMKGDEMSKPSEKGCPFNEGGKKMEEAS